MNKLFTLFITIFCSLLSFANADEPMSVPGRLGHSGIATAKFGKNRLYFYMTPEKHDMAKGFMQDIIENMLHGIDVAELDFPVVEVTPICTINKEPIDYDKDNQPIYTDTKGMMVFESHAQKVKQMIESLWGVTFHGLSKETSLIVNFDANKFHQDQFITQYQFLKNHPHPIPEYILVQDLTLVDFEMAKGTFSGTILQDEDTEDRFIFPLFDSQVACTVYTEPAIYLGPDKAPEYPGAMTLPPHSPMACVDRLGDLTPGSAKGKRVSISIRGLVTKKEMEEFASRSQQLDVDYPEIRLNSDNKIERHYSHGILFKELDANSIDKSPMTSVLRLPDVQNMELYETSAQDSAHLIEYIKSMFAITENDVKVLHLIKKDGGFSNFICEQGALNIAPDAKVVVLNRSKLPQDYKHFPIAEDFTLQGKPWIQLYPFSPNMAMKVSGAKLKDLAAVSAEEIIFRDARKDIESIDPNVMNEKIVIQLDLYVFQ